MRATVQIFLCALAIGALAGATVVQAHEMTYMGTVIAAEPARIQVKTIDEKTKKEDRLWFVVDGHTRIKRGDKPTSYKDAGVVKGERIVVVVDHDAATKMLAIDIRLAGRQ